ncbi:MAG TPA: hypothetical protein DEB15_07525 [Pusillimonas sp.]|jgi:hypothetical protein|nr:hypothetical protein [Pusillimonas sp.]
MRPLFTIHGGEYLVGEFIERRFPTLNVWIPSKDTGVDFLITNKTNVLTVSLQVKLSRDYRPPEATSDFESCLAAGGWLALSHEKIEKSTANYWVFVLVSHERRTKPRFIVIPPAELLKRLIAIHGRSKTYHFYPWITRSGITLDGRGLKKAQKQALSNGSLLLGERDLGQFLECWTPLENLARNC